MKYNTKMNLCKCIVLALLQLTLPSAIFNKGLL